jgi:hypothetical protein
MCRDGVVLCRVFAEIGKSPMEQLQANPEMFWPDWVAFLFVHGPGTPGTNSARSRSQTQMDDWTWILMMMERIPFQKLAAVRLLITGGTP